MPVLSFTSTLTRLAAPEDKHLIRLHWLDDVWMIFLVNKVIEFLII